MNSKRSMAIWGLMAALSLGIALYAYRYLIPDAPAVPGDIGRNPMAHPWLFVHAGLAATALVLGPFQFVQRLRMTRPRLHRWMGRTYVFCCLIGGSAGLLLAYGTTAGPIASAGFGTLAVGWMVCAAQAWRLALAGRFAEHRRWMIRSFALTFAAVTLRLYLPVAALSGYPFVEGYRLISWLCWVPNLIVAELYLRRVPILRPVAAKA